MSRRLTPLLTKHLIRSVRALSRMVAPSISHVRGDSPGIVAPSQDSAPLTIDLIGYSPQGFYEQKAVTLEQIDVARSQWERVWIDVSGLRDSTLIQQIGEKFGIHSLTLEDIATTSQRAKVEDYDDYLYIVCRSADLTKEGLDIEQMSLIVSKNVIISFQERPGDCFDGVRARLRSGKGRMRISGTDYLAYALLDSVVDSYFPVVEKLGDELDDLEDKLLLNPNESDIATVHSIKRDLLVLRRAIWPHREALSALARDESSLIQQETKTFIRDAYDHVVQIIDVVETYRELCSDLRDLYLSSVSNRMNEVMKVLTIIATLFIPLTFVVGVYGMNFDTSASKWNMPELRSPYGYPLTMAAMAISTILMIVWFYRLGWIGRRK